MSKTKLAPSGKQEAATSAPAPIVVGFDASDEGNDALELARMICEVRGARCIVATVLEYGPVSVHRAISDPEDSEADPIFKAAREKLKGIEVECRVAGTRSPGRMLAELAEREGAAMLVVGSPHHRSRASRVLLGSVAEHLLHSSPCQVAIAPPGYGETSLSHFGLDQISVAFDGTPESWRALKGAEELAEAAGATIEILVAEDPVVSAVEAEGDDGTRGGGKHVLAEALSSVRGTLEPQGEVVKSTGREVAPHIAEAIASSCDGNILVCGRRSAPDRTLLGSVTTHLLVAARCPVLIIPSWAE